MHKKKIEPGVGLTVKVADLRSKGFEFQPLLEVELTPRWVDSACHPSEVSEISTSVLVIEGTASATQPRPYKMTQPAATGCM